MLVFSEKITVSQILKFQQQLIEAFLNSTDMSEENKESPIVPVSMDSWVEWFRSVAPHIHSIRGKTIVIDLAGETILQEHFSSLIADISMISAIGARIVLVYGVRPQVEELMSLKAIESQYVNGIRVTTADALVCVKEAAGEARLDIEAAFSQGLPNTPMAHSQCRVVSGNFVIARPLGIIDGVDFKFTGVVRKVDSEAIHRELDGGRIDRAVFDDPNEPGNKVPGRLVNVVFPGIREQLLKLRADGYYLALASCKPEYQCVPICEHFHLTELLDGIYGASRDNSRLDKDQVIRYCFDKIGFDAAAGDKAVMIGDRYTDIDGAHACNLDAIGCRWGYAPAGEMEEHGAYEIIEKPEQIEEAVNRYFQTH